MTCQVKDAVAPHGSFVFRFQMRALPKHKEVPLTLILSRGMSQPFGAVNKSRCPSLRGRLSDVPPFWDEIDALYPGGGQSARHSPAGLSHCTNTPEMHDIELGYAQLPGRKDALHSESIDRARITALRHTQHYKRAFLDRGRPTGMTSSR